MCPVFLGEKWLTPCGTKNMSRCKGNDMFLYFGTESLHSCGECPSCGGREKLQPVGVEAQGKSHIRPDAGDAGRLGDKPPQPFAVDALQ